MAWSLESEILKLSEQENINQGIKKLGLMNSGSNIRINVEKDWYRSGSETYGLIFSVSSDKNTKKSIYFMKACCSTTFGKDLNETLEEWVKRRELLNSKGISTPKLFYYGKGVVIEEFIPYKLCKKIVNKNNSELIKKGLINLATSLDDCNFNPISIFSDLMSRGNDVVLVDFGSDLGHYAQKIDAKDSKIWTELNTFLLSLGLI